MEQDIKGLVELARNSLSGSGRDRRKAVRALVLMAAHELADVMDEDDLEAELQQASLSMMVELDQAKAAAHEARVQLCSRARGAALVRAVAALTASVRVALGSDSLSGNCPAGLTVDQVAHIDRVMGGEL